MVREKQQRYTVNLKVRVTPEQYQAIKAKAKIAADGNISTYARKILVDGYIIMLSDEIDRPLLDALDKDFVELKKIGTNVNQIAKKLNGGDKVAFAVIEDIKASLKSISNSFAMTNRAIIAFLWKLQSGK